MSSFYDIGNDDDEKYSRDNKIIRASSEMKLKQSKDYVMFKMKYQSNKNSEKIKLVSDTFFANNKNKYFFIYNNKIFRTNLINRWGKPNEIKIKIVLFNQNIKLENMFYKCSSKTSFKYQ